MVCQPQNFMMAQEATRLEKIYIYVFMFKLLPSSFNDLLTSLSLYSSQPLLYCHDRQHFETHSSDRHTVSAGKISATMDYQSYAEGNKPMTLRRSSWALQGHLQYKEAGQTGFLQHRHRHSYWNYEYPANKTNRPCWVTVTWNIRQYQVISRSYIF